MEVDDEQYPLTTLTTLTTYMDLKPPEKSIKPIANTAEEDGSNSKDETNPKKNRSSTYWKYKKEDMEKFYFLVLEKGISIRGAAKELNLPATTAQSWISLKRAHFQPEERNCEDKIEERFQWVTELLKTDVDYQSNCVFIDESGFNINLKRAMAWAPVGETPVVKTPKTKAKSHTIIGAISALGVVNMQLKVPKVIAPTPSKKRKGPGGTPKKLE
ncbi:hypothetical protein, partial, partial [Parasitella parasitica]